MWDCFAEVYAREVRAGLTWAWVGPPASAWGGRQPSQAAGRRPGQLIPGCAQWRPGDEGRGQNAAGWRIPWGPACEAP